MKDKTIFVTIGFIEPHKGQDILVNAIESIEMDLADKCEFWLVGQNNSRMAKALGERICDKPWIKMPGTVDRQQIHEMLERCDVLICPSRQDSMPTVCAEAMMHSVPCIVSDATGTAAYIEDGINGFIFKTEDSNELASKILWCANEDNSSRLEEMGSKARQVYENTFSAEVFEKNLLKYVTEMIET